MARCIELIYTTVNEKGGANPSTSRIIKVPEDMLLDNDITSTDLLDEMITAENDSSHPWNDISKLLIGGLRLNESLLTREATAKLIAELSPEQQLISKFPVDSIKIYSNSDVNSNFINRGDTNKLIKELLRNRTTTVALTTVPFDVKGNPVDEILGGGILGLYKPDADTILLYNPEGLELKELFKGLTGNKRKELLIHELVHANFYNNIESLPKEISINNIIKDLTKVKNELTDSSKLILESIGSSNEKIHEFMAYYISNSDFQNDVSMHAQDIKGDVLNVLMSNVSEVDYPLVLNILRKTPISISKLPSIQPKAESLDSSIENTGEDSDEDSDSLLFNERDVEDGLTMHETEGSPYVKPEIIKINNKEKRSQTAGYVQDVFNEATSAKKGNSKYRVNYEQAVNIENNNRMLLHKLKQHDLIRIPVRKEVNGVWVNDPVKATFRPIIDSFISDGELVFATASPKGKVVYYNSKDVKSIRRSKGVLDNVNLKTRDVKTLSQIALEFAKRTHGTSYTVNGKTVEIKNIPPVYEVKDKAYKYKDGSVKTFPSKIWSNDQSVYVSVSENARRNQKLNSILASNLEGDNKLTEADIEFETDTRKDDVYDPVNLSNLKPGDIIKSVFTTKEGRDVTYYAPIVSIKGDMIEVLKSIPSDVTDLTSKVLDTYFIEPYSVNGVYMLSDNHAADTEAMDKAMMTQIGDGFNGATGLNKVSFKNVNKQGLPFEKKNYNDFNNFNLTPEFLSGYREWRTNITPEAYEEMTLKQLLENGEDQIAEYYKYSLAIERRRSVTDNIGPGSYVQLEQVRMKQEGKEWSLNEDAFSKSDFKTVSARVISKNGDWLRVRTMEPEWKDGRIVGYKFNNRAVNVLQANPGTQAKDRYAIRSVFYNNSEGEVLASFLSDMKKKFKTNFEDSQHYFDTYKQTKSFPTGDYERFNFINRVNVHKNTVEDSSYDLSDGYFNESTVNKLSDLYELRFLKEDASYDDKLRMLTRAKKGSVILAKITERFNKAGELVVTKANYTSAIVTGFDNTTGRPIITYNYTVPGGGTRTVSRPVRLSELVGVGYANFTINDLGIEVDDFIKNTRDQHIKNYIDNKTVTTYTTEKEAKDSRAYRNLKNHVVIATMYVDPETGARSTNPKKYRSPNKEFYLAFPSKSSDKSQDAGTRMTPAESPYRSVWGDWLKKADTKTIMSALRPGDVITEEYEKGKYKETVISRIEGNVIFGYTLYSKKGTRAANKQFTAYGSVILGTSADGKGLNKVSKIELSYYGNNIPVETRWANIRENELTDSDKSLFAEKKTKSTKEKRRVKPSTNSQDNRKTLEKVESSYTTPSKMSDIINSNDLDIKWDDAPFSKSMSEIKSQEKVTLNELSSLVDNLTSMYNIEVKLRSSDDILEELGEGRYKYHKQRAFILNGSIYINTDFATLAEPVHEIGHLIIEGLKLTDSRTYDEIMKKVIEHPHYDTIADYYSELSEEKLNEEVFVTILGERFDMKAKDDGLDSKTEKWFDENVTFLKKIVNRIKRFFAKLFGIDSNRLFKSDADAFMNMSLNDILDSFNNNIQNGKYINEFNLVNEKYQYVKNNTLVKNSQGEMSSLYDNLTQNDFTDEFATNSWMYTKSRNFEDWHNGEIITNEDNEPKVVYRTLNNEFSENDTDDLGDAVFIKGNHKLKEGVYTNVPETDVKSVYTSVYDYKESPYVKDTIETYSSSLELPMIGSLSQVRNTIKSLSTQFGSKVFEPSVVDGEVYFVKYYDRPSNAVMNLKELLTRKNLIEITC